jgi:hypothetical protein
MTTRQVLAIAIKLFSIWFLAQLFIEMTTFIPYLQETRSPITGEVPGWAYALVSCSIIFVGLLLCKVVFKLSNSVLQSSPKTGNLTIVHESQQFLFQLGGLYFLFTGVLGLVASLITFMYVQNHNAGVFTIQDLIKPTSQILHCMIGLWLIFNSKWWALVFKKFRGHP